MLIQGQRVQVDPSTRRKSHTLAHGGSIAPDELEGGVAVAYAEISGASAFLCSADLAIIVPLPEGGPLQRAAAASGL